MCCRADSFCRFFLLWAPDVYGELSDADIEARGIEIITEDLEWDEPSPVHRPNKLAKKLKVRRNRAGDVDQDDDDQDDTLGMSTELAKESWEVRQNVYLSFKLLS